MTYFISSSKTENLTRIDCHTGVKYSSSIQYNYYHEATSLYEMVNVLMNFYL